MDESHPFIPKNMRVHKLALIHFAAIQICSLFQFLARTSSFSFLVLDRSSAKLLIPFLVNIFVEESVVTYVVCSVLSIVLVNELIKAWKIEQIASYACCVGVISNAITWFMALIIGSSDTKICGSIATIVALSEAIVYVNDKDHDIRLLTGIRQEAFWAIAFVGIVTVSWSTISVVVAALVSFVVLDQLHSKFNITRNEDFGWKSFVTIDRKREMRDFGSMVDSLGLAEATELSEVDRNRRLRALRAIEERLEAFQTPV